MTRIHHKGLLAGAIAVLINGPVWAGDVWTPHDQGRTPHTQSESRQPSGYRPLEQLKEAHPAASAHSGAPEGPAAPLASLSPSDLQGATVVNASGEVIGKVKTIVSSRSDYMPHAVISPDGSLDTLGREIVVPLSELTQSGNQLQTSVSMAELRSMPRYTRGQYVEVRPAEDPISEFSAFEVTPEGRRSAAGKPMTERGSGGIGGSEVLPQSPERGLQHPSPDPRRTSD